MALQTFPSLAGIGWAIDRQEIWQTRLQESAAGRETRQADWAAPRHQWDLTYEFLRQGTIASVTYGEYAQLQGFFDQQRGMFGTFLYQDADDNASTGQIVGTGNGTTTAFPLVKSFGNYVEPIYALTAAPNVYKTDWQGTQLQRATARTNTALQSGSLGTSPWTLQNCTVVASGTAPDGVSAANLMTTTSTGGDIFTRQASIAAGSGVYTASVYFKAGANSPFAYVQFADNANTNGGLFYLNTSTYAVVGSSVFGSATIVSVTSTAAASGWYRLTFTVSLPSGTTLARVFLGLTRSSSGGATLPPTTLGATGLWWGMQLEAGATATSYIPTISAATTVTDYSLTANTLGQNTVATFATAPASGATISADTAYAYVCRFTEDNMTFSKFMSNLYEAKKVSILSMK